MVIQPSRRGFIRGLASLVAAPAVIRAAKLMPISVVVDDFFVDSLLVKGTERYAFTYIPSRAYDLLFPGLRGVTFDYTRLEESYPKIFAPRVLPLIGKWCKMQDTSQEVVDGQAQGIT